MKAYLLTLIICCLTYTFSYSCRCVTMREFSQTLDQNDQIFVGKVISELTVSDTVKFQFDVIKKWKGKMNTQSTVTIGTSTGSCGVDFEIGATYVVYAKKGYTNICRRNKKLEETFDDRLLDHYFQGKELGKKLDEHDQKVLINRILPNEDADQNIAVVYDYRVLSPKEVYRLHPMRFNEGKYQLLELSEEERQELGTCVNKIIIMGYVIPKKGWKINKVKNVIKKSKLCET